MSRSAISVDEQLSHPGNFEENGRLYLVRCLCCGPLPRGTENYALTVATGTCAWCGWSREEPYDHREQTAEATS